MKITKTLHRDVQGKMFVFSVSSVVNKKQHKGFVEEYEDT